MLGYLDNQRSLSGVPTQAMYRELPDGSVVMARWLGNLPEIMVKEGPGEGGWATGIGLRPTTAAQSNQTWGGGSLNVGTGAYENANWRKQVLLLQQPGQASPPTGAWWFNSDANWHPEDAPAQYYRPLLGTDSMRYLANTDWQGTAGALQFIGPNNRLLGPWHKFGRYVFHNGRILLDLRDTEGAALFYGASESSHDNVVVGGCALVGDYKAPSSLIVAVYEFTDGGENTLTIKLMAVRVAWQGSVLRAARGDGGGVHLTQLAAYTVVRPHIYFPVFAFNRSATEGRCLMPRTADDNTAVTRMEEIVCAIGDGAAAFSSTTINNPTTSTQEQGTGTGSVSLATGALDCTTGSLVFPDKGDGDGVPAYYAETNHQIDVETDGWLKVSVDYDESGAPVYLEQRAKQGGETKTVNYSRDAVSGTAGEFPLEWQPWSFAQWSQVTFGQTPDPVGHVEVEIVRALAGAYTDFSYKVGGLALNSTRTFTEDTTYTLVADALGDYRGYTIDNEVLSRTDESVTYQLMHVDLRYRTVLTLKSSVTQERVTTEGSSHRDYAIGAPSRKKTDVTESTVERVETYDVQLFCNGVLVESDPATDYEIPVATLSKTDVSDPYSDYSFEPSFYTRLTFAPGDALLAGESYDTTTDETEITLPIGDDTLPDRFEHGYRNDFVKSLNRHFAGSVTPFNGHVFYSYPRVMPININDNTDTYLPDFPLYRNGVMSTGGTKITSINFFDITYSGSDVIRFSPIVVVSPFPTR